MQNNQAEVATKNYVGVSFVNDYKGEFNGFTTYLNMADLEELKKFMNTEGRVGVKVQFAKDPSKGYATMFTPKERGEQPQQSNGQGESGSDLPF